MKKAFIHILIWSNYKINPVVMAMLDSWCVPISPLLINTGTKGSKILRRNGNCIKAKCECANLIKINK